MKNTLKTNNTAGLERRRARRQKGSFMVEFAIVGWTLFLMMAGVLQVGLNLSRAMTAASVVRDANVLTVRGIDLSQTQNQELVARSAAGLGLSSSGSWVPSSTGTAVVYISKVIMVGPIECANGVTGFDGTSGTCPNLNKYVISMRIGIGNTTRWTSAIGNPASTPQSNGYLTDNQICTVAGNVTNSIPSAFALTADQYTFVSEVFADTSNINFFSFLTPTAIYLRNLS